jgi:hypothetical protein
MSHRHCRAFLLFATAMAFAPRSAIADQVVLKNGDRVTGAIVKKDAKTLTIKTEFFGVVTAPWDQVASVTADKPVNVVLKDGRTVRGTIATADGMVQVKAEGATVSVAPADITALRDADEQKAYERLIHPGWLNLWTGSGTVGLAGTAGNARTLTFSTGVNASRITRTDKTTIYFNAIKASSLVNGTNSETARAVRGGLAYDHNVNPRLFMNVFNDYEYDRFQDLDLRFVIGGGAGFHAVKTASSSLDLLAGFDYSHASFSTPLTRSSGELFWGDEYNLKLSSATTLVQSFRMFNNLSDTGAYRVNFDLTAATRIAKRFTWNVAFSDRYLSNPAPGRKTNDLLYTTGLGITFARQ